ncbi:MAG TPA: protein-glutamate O-methyltransferase CheR [Candidatus Limnocylindria bacterium]|jgi:chemotaxis protein methyltransferase CheR|nr:protein-glutamate O-methyltransferase CheR [Candidatus Limnocylindria bacterium]
MTPVRDPGARESRLNSEDKAIAWIVDEVYQRSRIRLHEGKETLIRTRLGKRMRKLGIPTLPEYCSYLQRSGDSDEFTHMLDALTTNFTNFLREEAHFQFLVKDALPSLLAGGQKQFTVWSAACATGEEPYSLAIYLAEHFPLAQGWDWHILATDISTKALGKAREGVFQAERVSTVPQAWVRNHFQKGSGEWAGWYRIKPELKERIQFEQFNLLGSSEPAQKFQTVFCRNVMIYFDRQTQEQLAARLARCLVPQGYLMIGHAESLNGLQLPYRLVKPSIYQLPR